MKPGYYDRNLHPISLEEWSLKFEDMDYRIVCQENIGRYQVSTVWMGLDHNFFRGPPLIFETMIFVDGDDDYNDDLHLYQNRYTTEKQAVAGHEEAVILCFEALKKERDSRSEEMGDLQKEESAKDSLSEESVRSA